MVRIERQHALQASAHILRFGHGVRHQPPAVCVTRVVVEIALQKLACGLALSCLDQVIGLHKFGRWRHLSHSATLNNLSNFLILVYSEGECCDYPAQLVVSE
jgi:hypothetical protein